MSKALLYDVDGTLVDSTPDLHNFFVYLCLKYQRTVMPMSVEETKKVYIEPSRNFMEIYKKLGFNWEEDKKFIVEEYKIYFADRVPQTFNGIKNLLEKAVERGYILGVASSNKKYVIEKWLDAHGLSNLFRSIISDDPNRNPKLKLKPAPDFLNLCLEELKVKPEDAYYIGDHPMDIAASHAAGTKSIAVGWGIGSLEGLLAERPTHFVESCDQIISILNL